jgi:hypothetical protein
MNSTSPKFGAANGADLAASLGKMPDAGIGTAFSFERAGGRSIDQVLHSCKHTSLPLSGPTCVSYVFCDDLERTADVNNFEDINLVWATDTSLGLADIENRIVLISRNGCAGCRSKATFLKMSDHANAIAQFGFGRTATIIFQLHSSTVTLYPSGITGGIFENRPFGTVSELLTGNKLETTLDYFDEQWVNAPQGHDVLWTEVKGHTHVPAKNTEKVIQIHLQLALKMADPNGLVMDEIPNADGRADLLLSSDTPAGQYSVILELKVLRSFSYPTTRTDGKVSPVADSVNQESALEVVRQASCYRQQFKAHRACARLYDMRKQPADDGVKKAALDVASKLAVDFWFKEVYFTSKEKRNAKVAKKLKA